jgi:sphingomyelin phosphodiesterase
MRISASTVILSLMAAATVTAAPTPVHIEKRGVILDKLKDTFAKALTSLQCSACVGALVAAKDVSYLNPNWVLDAGKKTPLAETFPSYPCLTLVPHLLTLSFFAPS